MYMLRTSFKCIIILILFYCSNSALGQEFITPLTNSPGIYFDPVGSLSLVDSHLSIVIPYDISFINPHILNLRFILEKAKRVCDNGKVFDYLECTNLFEPLNTRFKDIAHDNEAIFHLTSRQSKRSALIGFVGTISKKLFGTMDEDDAIRYDNAIKEVETDQKKLAILMKENILVTTSTLKCFNETLSIIKLNEKHLENAIEEMSQDILNLTYVSRELGIRSRMLEVTSMIENSLLALSFKVEDIINSVMFSKSNVLYPTILTPKELYTELVDNYRFLPESKQLPVPLNLDNIHTILNISEISSYFNKGKVVFVVKIPLINPIQLNVYHNLPSLVPHDKNNPKSYSTIIPSSKYIGISRDRSMYCKLDNLDYCKIVNNDRHLCETSILYSSSATPSCETEIITKVLTSIPSICETKFIHGHVSIWQPLRHNRWLFVMSERTRISIECNNPQSIEIEFSGNGILYLPSECIAYCKDTRLMPQETREIVMKPIISNYNILNDSCCNIEAFNNIVTNLPVVNLKNINLDSLAYDNPEILKSLNNIVETPHIVLYQKYYSGIMTVITISVMSFVIYKLYRTGIHKRIMKFRENKDPENNDHELDVNPSSISMGPSLRIG